MAEPSPEERRILELLDSIEAKVDALIASFTPDPEPPAIADELKARRGLLESLIRRAS